MKFDRFYIAVGIAVLLIGFLAYQDIVGFSMFQGVGGYSGETYLKMQLGYSRMFWNFAYGLIIVAAAMYLLLKRDWSETLAVACSFLFLLWGGLEDILYYKMLNLPLDQSMPWLYDNCFFIGGVARLIGLDTVTPYSLWLSLMISAVITYLSVKWLKKQKW